MIWAGMDPPEKIRWIFCAECDIISIEIRNLIESLLNVVGFEVLETSDFTLFVEEPKFF